MKIRKKRIRWSASPSPDVVGYRLYWASKGNVSYQSDFLEIVYRREIILPDQVPSLGYNKGEVELGLTAVNAYGNESAMVRFTVNFELPVSDVSQVLVRSASEGWEAPQNTSILVDDLNHQVIREMPPLSSGDLGCAYDYYIDSHHVDETAR